MSIRNFLDTAPLKPIIRYDGEGDYRELCVPFIGAPRKHPYDADKMLLVTSPFSSNTQILEFRLQDIHHAENLPGIGTDTGENLILTRIWVTRGSFGLKYEPFEVDQPLRYFKDSELLHQVLNERD